METKEIILRVKDLIKDEDAWVQKKYASNEAGEFLAAGDLPSATKWCLAGAVEKVCGCGTHVGDVVGKQKARIALEEALPPLKRSLEEFNDTHTHEEVVEVLDRCLASL